MKGALDEMKSLRNWFESCNDRIAFYASSVMIVYEGNDHTLATRSSHVHTYSFKLIDFAHVHSISNPGSGIRDWNYIYGLNVLIEIFESIYCRSQKQSDITKCK